MKTWMASLAMQFLFKVLFHQTRFGLARLNRIAGGGHIRSTNYFKPLPHNIQSQTNFNLSVRFNLSQSFCQLKAPSRPCIASSGTLPPSSGNPPRNSTLSSYNRFGPRISSGPAATTVPISCSQSKYFPRRTFLPSPHARKTHVWPQRLALHLKSLANSRY